MDLLLVLLKKLCNGKRKNDLKVILMSATLDSELFSEYFTKCPIIKIPGRTFPVKSMYLEDLISESKIIINKPLTYKLTSHDERIKLNRIKEAYMGTPYNDRVFNQLVKWDDSNSNKIDVELLCKTILHINKKFNTIDAKNNDRKCAILVFLPGVYEITETESLLHELIQRKQMDMDKFWILPLHSKLPTLSQKKVFDIPPNGVTKIVLSTNIAETSITINDVKYVIDCGKMRESEYDRNKRISVLKEIWISRGISIAKSSY